MDPLKSSSRKGKIGGGKRKPSEVLELFYICIWMVVTWVYTYTKFINLYT